MTVPAAGTRATPDFSEGVHRYVKQTPDGRQYVLGPDGEAVFGVCCRPAEDCDEPAVVHDAGAS